MKHAQVYTVRQLAALAGVSRRTLHFYDEIGLLKPPAYGENGYRYYDEHSLLRLQQILFYRELGLNLEQIKEILDQPAFDTLQALQSHRAALGKQAERLQQLVRTVDKTILHLQGAIEMSDNELYQGFSAEQQKEYEEEARQRWGADRVNESVKRWNSYSPEKQKQILAEGGQITQGIVANMSKGPGSPEVQAGIAAWHRNMGYFYECSYEQALRLGHLYVDDPRFAATYRKFHPDLPEFLLAAIEIYCQGKV